MDAFDFWSDESRNITNPRFRSWPRSGLMNLGRPFKAGEGNAINNASRERRQSSTVARATDFFFHKSVRALKGPTKFIPAAARPVIRTGCLTIFPTNLVIEANWIVQISSHAL